MSQTDLLESCQHLQTISQQSAENIMSLAVESQKIMSQILTHMQKTSYMANGSTDSLGSVTQWMQAMTHSLQSPENLSYLQNNFWQHYVDIWQQTTQKILGEDYNLPTMPVMNLDRRLRGAAWEEPGFDFVRQFYALYRQGIDEMLQNMASHFDDQTYRRLSFTMRQFLDALSPANFVLTNPQVLKATIEQNGENLVRGMQNFMDDLQRGNGVLKITQTDDSHFTVGQNLAVTPGRVIFRNRLIELIQYIPTTDTVYAEPLLIVPPWINKFYILDLQPSNSMINWLLSQGRSVFVISWVNPDHAYADYSFTHYFEQGLYPALEQVYKACDGQAIHAMGYCIGGTLLAMGLSVLAQQKRDIIASASFLTTQTDFSQAGELGIFVDDNCIDTMKQLMQEHGGFLEGHDMAMSFNMLRANDLIWNFVVNNYLMGKTPPPFDLLYWNSDSTRMPMQLQLDYLTDCYRDNKLAKGQMMLGNYKINLQDITLPIFMQASRDDHIAPAVSVYRGARLLKTDLTFILAGSGHIAGVINHPDKNKYQFWHHTQSFDKAPEMLEEWIEGAQEIAGSWWKNWQEWMISKQHNPAMIPAQRYTPDAKLPAAPGQYIHNRV